MNEEQIRADERFRVLHRLRSVMLRKAATSGESESEGVRVLLDAVTGAYHRAREESGRDAGSGAMDPRPDSNRQRQLRQAQFLGRMARAATCAEVRALAQQARDTDSLNAYGERRVARLLAELGGGS